MVNVPMLHQPMVNSQSIVKGPFAIICRKGPFRISRVVASDLDAPDPRAEGWAEIASASQQIK